MDFSRIEWPGVLRRVLRTFLQAFLALYPATNLVAWLSGYEDLDVGLLRAAAVSGLIACSTLLWNVILDPSPVPSLTPPAEPEETRD